MSENEQCYIVEDGTNDRQCVDVAHTIPKIYDSESRAQTVIDCRYITGIQDPVVISVAEYNRKYRHCIDKDMQLKSDMVQVL